MIKVERELNVIMAESVEAPSVAQPETSGDKISVEIDKSRLDGLVQGYEKSLRRTDRSEGEIKGRPEDIATLRLTREFFDVIGQPGMIQAAENRQKIVDLKREEQSRVSQEKSAKEPPTWR